jgi:hypothetical protein
MSRNDARVGRESKTLKKDQQVRREVLTDLDDATDRPEVGQAEPRYKGVNRDQARGDWDRSRQMDE